MSSSTLEVSPSKEKNSPVDVAFAASKIRIDGYFVLENAFPLAMIERLRERFMQILEEKARTGESNRGPNRFQMYLPFEPPFSSPELYAHPVVLEIVREVLGDDILLTYLASDTPFPGSDYQRVHSDTRLLFPETPLSLPAYGIVVNVPLVDFTEENGPMELWPGGTHLMPGPMDIARLAPEMKSVRLLPKAGSALIRDLRAWHRGTPNRSNYARPNLALVYTRSWYRFEQKPIEIPAQEYQSLPEDLQKLLRANAIVA